MIKVITFLVRWGLTSLGFWIIVRLFGDIATQNPWQTVGVFLLAGLIFAIVNSIIKPAITVLSLPFVLVTMGLFMLIINGFMVWLTIVLVPDLAMNFGQAIIGGIVLSLVNYLVSGVNEIIEDSKKAKTGKKGVKA
jgi:putative membrane protein